MLPLVLYDIPSALPGKSWSPNPYRPRFILSYKKLPFDTVWIEYADIPLKLKEIGAPLNKLQDGKEKYTLPVISDPNTGAFVTDSWAIAEYLDETYPEKPIFPEGSKGLITAFDAAMSALGGASIGFSFLRSSEVLSGRSREAFIRIRAEGLGVGFDEWSPEGPIRDAQWDIIEKGYRSAKAWYDKVEGKWLMGNTFCYADVIMAVRTLWLKRVHHDDEWKRIASFHDGKWEKFLTDVLKECNLA